MTIVEAIPPATIVTFLIWLLWAATEGL